MSFQGMCRYTAPSGTEHIRNLKVSENLGLLTLNVVSGAHILSGAWFRRMFGAIKLSSFSYYSERYVEMDRVFWTIENCWNYGYYI